MSKSKIIVIKIAVFLILIAISLTISYFFHGLMYDLIHKSEAVEPPAILEPNKPNQDEIKEIVSTTIVSEKYGTFELPVSNMLLSNMYNNMVFLDGTDFNYIWETEFEKVKKINSSVTDSSNLIFIYDGYHMLTSDILKGVAYNNTSFRYFVPENKVVNYIFTGEMSGYEKVYPLCVYNSFQLAITLPNNSSVYTNIDVKFYCKNLAINETVDFGYGEEIVSGNFLSVIISDKGCPLTDYIYDEIFADETTKITYNYAD